MPWDGGPSLPVSECLSDSPPLQITHQFPRHEMVNVKLQTKIFGELFVTSRRPGLTRWTLIASSRLGRLSPARK